MKLQYYLNENKNITLYHGSDYKTQKIDSSLMMQTLNNSLEGVGIYFGDLEMAEHYGTVVIPARSYKPRDKAKAETAV